jgi:predicted nucleic-acid-binding Zn-ribbon protein
MSTEEFDDYAARLYEVLDTTGTAFSKLTDIETQAFYNLTAKIKLAEDGFSALQATSKDTWKILNKQTKVSTSEYSKTLSAMKSNMSKIFGVDLKKLTNKFVEDHLDELHKMATGTEKEAIAAQDAIQDDLVAAFMETEGLDATVTINVDGVPTAINILDLFQNQLDQWDGEDIGFTITPNIAPALDSMNSLIQAGTMAST